jgi:lysophospholipase L1-like esterase
MKSFSRAILRSVAWLAALFPVLASVGRSAETPFTIVAFGDSTTALRRGFEVYPSQLASRFKSAGVPVGLVNKGVPGDSTDMARKRFTADVIGEKPNLVIIQFGINDSSIDVSKVPPATRPRLALADFEANLRYFVAEVRKAGAEAILMTPNQMRWTPKLLKLYGKAPYHPGDELGMNRPMEPYVEAVRRIAREMNVALVDVYAMFGRWERMHHRSCAELLSDGMHPNTAGHTLIADALEPLVAQATAGALKP